MDQIPQRVINAVEMYMGELIMGKLCGELMLYAFVDFLCQKDHSNKKHINTIHFINVHVCVYNTKFYL